MSDPKQVREWARSQGIEVGKRGRVPVELVKQFEASQVDGSDPVADPF